MNKKRLPMVLIFIVLLFSVLGYLRLRAEDKEEKNKITIDSVGKKDTKIISNIDTTHILFRIEDKTNYFLLKDLNYPLVKFFNNINNDNYSEIEVFPAYKKFFNLSDYYFKDKLGKSNTLDYNIDKISNLGDIYHFTIRYKEEGTDTSNVRIFTTDGRYIIDEPFLKVVEINDDIENDKFKINLKAKAIFDTYEVYKIIIESKSDEMISIQPDMFGFYAKDDLNRYYHKIVGTDFGYDIRPKEVREFNIRFDTLSFDELYVIIDGEDIKIK